jgi:hypothetical protein
MPQSKFGGIPVEDVPKSKFGGIPVYDETPPPVPPDPNAAIKAAQAAKFPTKAEGGSPDLPWYTGLLNRGDPSSPRSQGLSLASELTAAARSGVPEAITGIPGSVYGLGKGLVRAGQAAVDPTLRPSLAADLKQQVTSMVTPFTTPAKQFVEAVKPGLVNAPDPGAPETTAAARGAGTFLGQAVLGATVGGLAKGETPTLAKGLQQVAGKVKPLITSPGLDAATVNKWMDVPASAVQRGANPGKQLLDDNLLGGTKAATKVNVDSELAKAGQQMEAHLGKAAGEIDAQTPVYDAVAQAKKRIGRPKEAAFEASLQGIVDDIEARYPNLGKLTPKEAHALKVELGDSIRWKGAAVDEPVNQAMMQIYHDLNKAIQNEVPGIGDLQSRWGNLYVASKNLSQSLAEDIVGKGSGAGVPPAPPSPLWQAMQKYGPGVVKLGAGGTGAYGVYRKLTKP